MLRRSRRSTVFPHITWNNTQIKITADDIIKSELYVNGAAPVTIQCERDGVYSEQQIFIEKAVKVDDILKEWNTQNRRETQLGYLTGLYEVTIVQSSSVCYLTVTPGKLDASKSELEEPKPSKHYVGDSLFIKYKPRDQFDNVIEYNTLTCVITNKATEQGFTLTLLNIEHGFFGSPIPVLTRQGFYSLQIKNSEDVLVESGFTLQAGEIEPKNCFLYQEVEVKSGDKVTRVQRKVDSSLRQIVRRDYTIYLLLADKYNNVIKDLNNNVPISLSRSKTLTCKNDGCTFTLSSMEAGSYFFDCRLIVGQKKVSVNGCPLQNLCFDEIDFDQLQPSFCGVVGNTTKEIGELLVLPFNTFDETNDTTRFKQIHLIHVEAKIGNDSLEACAVSREDGFDVNIFLTKPGKLEIYVFLDGKKINEVPYLYDVINSGFVKYL